MGLIDKVLGGAAATEALGRAATSVAEVFKPNATAQMANSHEAYIASLSQYGTEFSVARPGIFDSVVNGLNRLPRPFLAFGTLGLFVYAMIDPVSFSQRMVGLGYIPEPLWWLLGAIVGFYFGAREAFHFRAQPSVAPRAATSQTDATGTQGSHHSVSGVGGDVRGVDGPEENEALMDWMVRHGRKPAS
ncbi:holin family protein [Albirhodobacter sp. R86504]|uniref:holin family protein n=1 Tax=Albirhodobacter sp. R86504 TaxID=3093848 RepID=UPI00366DE483